MGLSRIGVVKSASHQLSQNEIGGDNPCSQHLSGNILVSDWRVNQDLAHKLSLFVDLALAAT